jgi:uncharacterized membrane protein
MENNKWHLKKTWHQQSTESMTFGQRLADSVATGMGSWRFIIWQTIIVAIWMTLNVILIRAHQWDGYPFILLNLVFSTQAAYAAPIIMMAQNRQNERDRSQADADYRTNCEAKIEIEELQKRLNAIEIDKLDKIMAMVQEIKDKK